jgi:pyroglutamyl-peptidase
MSTQRTILLTGFGPFPGIPVNASGLLVPVFGRAARKRFPDLSIKTLVLPTEWQRGPARVAAAIERIKPDVAIHFGVSPKAHGFVVERRGVNTCMATADGAGELPVVPHLDADGPGRLAVTLPVEAIIAGLRRAGLPAVPSDDAGTYLCNAVLYRSLGRAESATTEKSMIAGFIHIPAGLAGAGVGQRRPVAGCPLTREQVVAGSMIIIEACLAAVSMA